MNLVSDSAPIQLHSVKFVWLCVEWSALAASTLPRASERPLWQSSSVHRKKWKYLMSVFFTWVDSKWMYVCVCVNLPCSSCSLRQGRCCRPTRRSPARCGPPGWASAGCSTGRPWGRNTPPALHLDGRNLCEKGRKHLKAMSGLCCDSVWNAGALLHSGLAVRSGSGIRGSSWCRV